MSRELMPIMSGKLLKAIPWAMIAPHDAQAESNHSQSLERLAQRGGLAPSEALDILQGRRWGSAKACDENEQFLLRLVAFWLQSQKKPIAQAQANEGGAA